ncbi:MAG: hypothetical protein LUQ07_06710 [Methanospirillum sp.]|nr:hypothetical protein [Methanospirillum sp.]
MKKKYLTYAGIISALILVAMFISVFFIKSPVLFLIPVITVDPVTDRNVDDNNFLVLTGKTNLPEKTHIQTYVYPLKNFFSLDDDKNKPVARGDEVWFTGNDNVWNFWKGTVNISSLEPAEYLVVFKTVDYVDNYTRIIESGRIASFQFTLGNDTCSGGCVRKKERREIPFIRINPVSGETAPFEITGITSLVPATPLVWKIEEKTGTTITGNSNYLGNGTVIQGAEGINRWSAMLPSGIPPGSYRMTVSAPGDLRQGNRSETISASLEWNYTGSREDPLPGNAKRSGGINSSMTYITIDALPRMSVNEKYVLSGTTNLPPSEDLCVEITPPDLMLNYNFTFNPRDKSQGGTISGIAGCMPIVNSSWRENLWTFEIQTYSLAPGQYEVNISNIKTDPGSLQIMPGTVTKKKRFILHG